MPSVKVRVPASSANLGPGFDAFAIALGRYLSVTVTPDHCFYVATALPDGSRNLVQEAMLTLAAEVHRPLPSCRVEVHSEIPVARGLGSSAAAIVAGLVAANVLLESPLTPHDLLRLAWALEGHGDNVAAALFGGVVLAYGTADRPYAYQLPLNLSLTAVLLIPQTHGYTSDARAVLPESVPRAVAVVTATRCALLTLALTAGKPELLREAMADDLHQPYRAQLYPYLPEAITVACAAGAFGAALSGAGPSVIALTNQEHAERVAQAFEQFAVHRQLAADVAVLPVVSVGAQYRLITEHATESDVVIP